MIIHETAFFAILFLPGCYLVATLLPPCSVSLRTFLVYPSYIPRISLEHQGGDNGPLPVQYPCRTGSLQGQGEGGSGEEKEAISKIILRWPLHQVIARTYCPKISASFSSSASPRKFCATMTPSGSIR